MIVLHFNAGEATLHSSNAVYISNSISVKNIKWKKIQQRYFHCQVFLSCIVSFETYTEGLQAAISGDLHKLVQQPLQWCDSIIQTSQLTCWELPRNDVTVQAIQFFFLFPTNIIVGTLKRTIFTCECVYMELHLKLGTCKHLQN